jgi:hypothetical protein
MKKSEKMLLMLFGLLFLIIVGGGGLMLGINKYREIARENEQLRDRLIEMNTAVTQGLDWQRKADWIDENVPGLGSKQEASTRLLETIQKEAAEAGVTLTGKEFVEQRRAIGIDGQPEESGGYFDQATVRVTLVQVQEGALFKWLHAISEPKQFLGVTRLQMTPTGQGKTVNCEVELTQYYREKVAPKLTRAP